MPWLLLLCKEEVGAFNGDPDVTLHLCMCYTFFVAFHGHGETGQRQQQHVVFLLLNLLNDFHQNMHQFCNQQRSIHIHKIINSPLLQPPNCCHVYGSYKYISNYRRRPNFVLALLHFFLFPVVDRSDRTDRKDYPNYNYRTWHKTNPGYLLHLIYRSEMSNYLPWTKWTKAMKDNCPGTPWETAKEPGPVLLKEQVLLYGALMRCFANSSFRQCFLSILTGCANFQSLFVSPHTHKNTIHIFMTVLPILLHPLLK